MTDKYEMSQPRFSGNTDEYSMEMPGISGRRKSEADNILTDQYEKAGMQFPGATKGGSWKERVKQAVEFGSRNVNPQTSGIGGYPQLPQPAVPKVNAAQKSLMVAPAANVALPGAGLPETSRLSNMRNPQQSSQLARNAANTAPLTDPQSTLKTSPDTETQNVVTTQNPQATEQPTDNGITIIRGNYSGTGNAGAGRSFDVSRARPDANGSYHNEGLPLPSIQAQKATETALKDPTSAQSRTARAYLTHYDPVNAENINNIVEAQVNRQTQLEAERIAAQAKVNSAKISSQSENSGFGPSFETYSADLKKANPNASDEEIMAYAVPSYREKYGY